MSEVLDARADFQKELSIRFTDVRDNHYQRCHQCNDALITLRDYYGGGSHYWVLVCGKCVIRFVYDTYRFALETWPAEGKSTMVKRWGKPLT